MTSNITSSRSQTPEEYTRTVQRLMRVARDEHIPDKGMSQWWFANGVERIDFDHEQFTRTATARFMPAIEYRSGTRYLYRLPDYSTVVLWTQADYTEFDTYTGNITVPDGYELWINNEWLVLSNGISIESELGNWRPATPLNKVTADIASITTKHHSDIEGGAPAVKLEEYGLQATEPDDMDVENAIIDSEYDSLRYEYGRGVADQWAKEKRTAIHQWMRRHRQQGTDNERKAGNR
jgi:hypothetical protein